MLDYSVPEKFKYREERFPNFGDKDESTVIHVESLLSEYLSHYYQNYADHISEAEFKS